MIVVVWVSVCHSWYRVNRSSKYSHQVDLLLGLGVGHKNDTLKPHSIAYMSKADACQVGDKKKEVNSFGKLNQQSQHCHVM